jgi:hypothetical protein
MSLKEQSPEDSQATTIITHCKFPVTFKLLARSTKGTKSTKSFNSVALITNNACTKTEERSFIA